MMSLEIRSTLPGYKNRYHFYGCFNFPARYRKATTWMNIATRLKVFVQKSMAERGWRIYAVSLGHKQVSFVVEAISCPKVIVEKLLKCTLDYLWTKFPEVRTFDEKLFWANSVCIPIRCFAHFNNTLKRISRWEDNAVKQSALKTQKL
jgi:hypothetical protein